MTMHNDAPTVAAPLSTITPAEVSGLWVPANPEHAKLGWTYDFEQTERIARAAYDSTGYDATMEVVEFVMAEADRRHATALAAKDAELAVQREAKEHARRLCDCAEARLAEAKEELNVLRANQIAHVEVRARLTDQLAEARKALASNASTFEAIRTHIDERSLPLARGLCSQGSFAARRALTGGKKDG